MDEEPLTREQRQAMLDLLEQAALHDYPNPERIGCPPSDFLKRLALDRKSINLDDPALDHVARCSPCYKDFLAFRKAAKRSPISRRSAFIIAGAAAAAALAGIAVKSSMTATSRPVVYESAEINLLNAGQTRGPVSAEQANAPKANLPRKPLDLQIILPFASPEGDYEVQVLHANGYPTGLKASGQATLLNGKTSMRVRINLSSLPRDRYQIGIRRVPFDWMPVPVQVQ